MFNYEGNSTETFTCRFNSVVQVFRCLVTWQSSVLWDPARKKYKNTNLTFNLTVSFSFSSLRWVTPFVQQGVFLTARRLRPLRMKPLRHTGQTKWHYIFEIDILSWHPKHRTMSVRVLCFLPACVLMWALSSCGSPQVDTSWPRGRDKSGCGSGPCLCSSKVWL